MTKATVFDVAKYILALFKKDDDLPITTWKLQKLVYYSQVWSLVWDDAALFEDRIEAWANGPVCPELYKCHKGLLKISSIEKGNLSKIKSDQKKTIMAVYKHYSPKTAQYLSALTHQEVPWKSARGKTQPGERSKAEITQDSMALYYGGL